MNFISRLVTPSKSDQSGMVQPMPEPVSASKAEETAREDMRKKKKKIAGSKTIFADPLGLSGQAQVVRKTLLGE